MPSSVCECPWGHDYVGTCVMGPRTARTIPKSGNICPNCKHPVPVGARCVDYAGIRDDGSGFFHRFHFQCFRLMESFAEQLCGGEWAYPFDLEEAAEHAMAHGHEPQWKDWLLLYEQTWAWREEVPHVHQQ